MRAPTQGQSIKADVFRAIERRFLLGLRARNPATRAKFFRLLHDNVAPDLFSRLKYIIMEQDWENVASTFWLRHGLVRLSHLIYAIQLKQKPCCC